MFDVAVSEEEMYLHGLPQEVLDTKWDVILVDGPTGYDDQQYVKERDTKGLVH